MTIRARVEGVSPLGVGYRSNSNDLHIADERDETTEEGLMLGDDVYVQR